MSVRLWGENKPHPLVRPWLGHSWEFLDPAAAWQLGKGCGSWECWARCCGCSAGWAVGDVGVVQGGLWVLWVQGRVGCGCCG